MDGETVAVSYHQTSWDAENAANSFLAARGGGQIRICDGSGAIQAVKRWSGSADGNGDGKLDHALAWEPPQLTGPWPVERQQPLTVTPRSVDGVLVLEIAGELDLSTVPELVEALRDPGDVKGVVVDLLLLDFMDSSGLHALLAARRRLHTDGKRLSVLCPLGSVRRILELTGMETVLNVHAEMRDALAAASDGA